MNLKYLIKDKIKTLEELLVVVNHWRLQDKKVVFTNGCFDILHLGHLYYLQEAATLGDRLIVAINTDESVKRLKGHSRPINNINTRLAQIAALQMVDISIAFGEDTPMNLIKQIKPDILVKGGDWKINQIVGADFIIENGGSVKSLSFIENHSTTDIIKKIQNQKNPNK